MSGTIFDLVEGDLPQGKEGYLELAKRAPKVKDASFLNDIKEYGKTALKGTIEGITKLGHALGPLEDYKGRSSREIQEQQTEKLEELIPTEDESFGQKGLRRGLREAPTLLSFPGSTISSTLPRSLLAGFLGEGAKELGAPEWAQSALELTAFIGPDITKKLLETGKDKDLIAFAKKMGMTNEQITPLIQSEFKQKWLTKISPKRGSTQTALKNTKTQLDETYSTLQKSPQATLEISEQENGKLLNGIFEKLNEMPRNVREKIEKDLGDLVNNKITGESLMNFWKDINANAGEHAKQLSLLKEPIKNALNSISPELSKDFGMLNQLYTKYFPIAARLKPNLVSDLISAAEYMGILGSFTFGYYPPLISLLGEKVGKKVAQQMLINPRLQQLSKKMVKAMNENKTSIVKKLTEAFSNQIEKTSPEAAEELDKISTSDIEELLKHHHTKQEE